MEKFRLKIVSTWYSNKFVYLKYSTNRWRWKKLYNYEYDVLDKWCYFTPVAISINNVEGFIKKFKTIEDIRKYEEIELKKVNRRNKALSEQKKKEKEKSKMIYKKYRRSWSIL